MNVDVNILVVHPIIIMTLCVLTCGLYWLHKTPATRVVGQ
jgi:hypothetical protein